MRKTFRVTLLAIVLSVPGAPLHAQARMPRVEASSWFARLEIATNGQLLPGASAKGHQEP